MEEGSQYPIVPRKRRSARGDHEPLNNRRRPPSLSYSRLAVRATAPLAVSFDTYRTLLMNHTLRLLVAVGSLTLAVPAFAQGGGGGGGGRGGANMAERQAQMRAAMFKDITLTVEQTARIDTIQTATRAKQREMMQSGAMDREKMQANQAEERKAIRALLTLEQAEVYDKNLAAMPGRRGGL